MFIAYSHQDKNHLEELRVTLSPLIRNNKVKIWFDGEIKPGDVWDAEIKKEIHSADIILLLLSTYSLNSDYFYEKEVNDALSRHDKGMARVIPILISPCLWDETPLQILQVLPKGAKPISEWSNSLSAWNDVAKGIKLAIDESIKTHEKTEILKLEEERRKAKEFKEQELRQKLEEKKKETAKRYSLFTDQITKSNQLINEKLWKEAEYSLRDALSKWEVGFIPNRDKIILNISKCISNQVAVEKLPESKINIEKFLSYIKNRLKSFFLPIKKIDRKKAFWSTVVLVLLSYSIFVSTICFDLNKDTIALQNNSWNTSNELNHFVKCYSIIISKIKFIDNKNIQTKKAPSPKNSNSAPLTYLDKFYADELTELIPSITYYSSTNQILDLEIKIFDGSGTLLLSSDKSKSYSVLCSKIQFYKSNSTDIVLCPYKGNSEKERPFSAGYYRIEIWYNSRCLGFEVIKFENKYDLLGFSEKTLESKKIPESRDTSKGDFINKGKDIKKPSKLVPIKGKERNPGGG